MRLTWIDAIKGFAILLVVFGHVENGLKEAGIFPQYNELLQVLWDMGHSFRMPLFFLLSGYLYEITWNERGAVSWQKIKGKVLDVYVLYLLFAVLYWLMKYGAEMMSGISLVKRIQFWDLILIPVKPFNYLWFLWVLALLFLTVPLLGRLCRKRAHVAALFAVGYLVPWNAVLPGILAGGAMQFFYGGLYFTLGSYLRHQHFETTGLDIRTWMIPLSLGICAANGASYLWLGHGILTGRAQEAVIALAASYLIWYVFVQYWDRRNWLGNEWLRLCGEKSLHMYLLHMPLVGMLRILLPKWGITNIWVLIIGITVAASVVPLGVARLCERWRWLDAVFHPADVLRKHGLL